MSDKQIEDTAVQNHSLVSTSKQVPIQKITYHDSRTFENCFHINGVFEGLQTFHKNKDFCDIQLETRTGSPILGHRNVLASASKYFHTIFTSLEESSEYRFYVEEIDNTILKLLVDFIYYGKITVSLDNFQRLLPAAKLLQLHYVESVCCEFLQTIMQPSNCHVIKLFAESCNCIEFLSSYEAYIKKNFMEIVECEWFLVLTFEEVLKLISYEDLNISSEEKVFECVINWVKHQLTHRKDNLPQLMEQVRLPFVSKKYILKVLKEPLIKESSECNDYVIEALDFHHFKTEPHCNIPENVRCKPRQCESQKVILAFYCFNNKKDYTEIWYDPSTNEWYFAPKLNTCCVNVESEGFIVKDNYLFSFVSTNVVSMMYMLNLSVQSPLWILNIPMLLKRRDFGVGIIDNCIFVVGGVEPGVLTKTSNEVQVYDLSIHKWKKVSSMITKRKMVGVGVLDNFLYVVGGQTDSSIVNHVERYNPILDTWSSMSRMSQRRCGAGVGVLNGVIYAVGGNDGAVNLRSAEIYTPCGDWSPIPDMFHCRNKPVVIAFNGLIYVMGGVKAPKGYNQSTEIYDPIKKEWLINSLDTKYGSGIKIYAGVVIDRPPHFKAH